MNSQSTNKPKIDNTVQTAAAKKINYYILGALLGNELSYSAVVAERKKKSDINPKNISNEEMKQ